MKMTASDVDTAETYPAQQLGRGVYTVEEFAARMGRDRSTVHAWIRKWRAGDPDHGLPVLPHKVGGFWRFRKEEVERWLRGEVA